ncbi:MAG: carboxylesterase family protein [Steroidobacteraceae bacterium]
MHRTLLMLCSLFALSTAAADTLRIGSGRLTGIRSDDGKLRLYLGIPYARPPLGALRWQEPQPPQPWSGVRKARRFGSRCMQLHYFDDMVFRSADMSEDCLYLNVWTPATRRRERLPVLVYFHGGGLFAGDGSEPRYDGARLARQGIVVVTVNYRLGVFGFLAHPELSAAASHRGSGNYGFLDQSAALRWVRENIAAFGGDPRRITIGGESAGSVSVSALMASSLSRDLIAGAIGESGSILGTLSTLPLAEAEQQGVELAQRAGVPNLAGLRALPAERLMTLAGRDERGANIYYRPTLDGRFFTRPPRAVFAAGEQAQVPLLAGANSAEGEGQMAVILGREPPTLENYRAGMQRKFGTLGAQLAALYPAAADGVAVLDAARDVAGDLFIGYSTWRWVDAATRSVASPTYFYRYAHPRPAARGSAAVTTAQQPTPGATHASEIEYALGNLDNNPDYDWSAADRQVSATMFGYFTNFIRSGDPNGPGLPTWPRYASGQRQRIDVITLAEPDDSVARLRLLDQALNTP